MQNNQQNGRRIVDYSHDNYESEALGFLCIPPEADAVVGEVAHAYEDGLCNIFPQHKGARRLVEMYHEFGTLDPSLGGWIRTSVFRAEWPWALSRVFRLISTLCVSISVSFPPLRFTCLLLEVHPGQRGKEVIVTSASARISDSAFGIRTLTAFHRTELRLVSLAAAESCNGIKTQLGAYPLEN